MSETDGQMLGITVLPEYFQVEGVERVLDNCQDVAGATAITTSPYVMRLSNSEEGQREPPIDAGAGDVRLLDRPLWGKRELFVSTSPSFHANKSLYINTCYQPPQGDKLTETEGEVVAEALSMMKSRGLKTFFQVQAAIPPGYRVQFSGVVKKDEPLLPNGRQVDNRVAANASLASEDVLNYQIALIKDLFQQYPNVDGVRIDWPEYPPYKLDSAFLDFNPQVSRWCLDEKEFSDIRQVVSEAYHWLHGNLTDEHVRELTSLEALSDTFHNLGFHQGLSQWLKLKQRLVTNYIERVRTALDDSGFKDRLLVPHAFPPPFHYLSGIDYGAIGEFSDHIAVKMYTMHWSMIARFYLDQLAQANPSTKEDALIKMVYSLLEISDEPGPSEIQNVKYPGPDDPQLPTAKVQQKKFAVAQQQAGDTQLAALVHGYGPVEEFASRFRTAYKAAGNFAWVNRYCYLSDSKLRVLGEITHGS